MQQKLEKHVDILWCLCLNVNANANAASGLIHGPISANAIELTMNFDIPSQLGSKRDIRILHTAYVES